ncbi:hypothetical protein D915_003236 [Fasciola hepatica]|uniref:Uncharacterized protein n=1 Tax=Fasciola hepatica TaxID=6192 RepID=A0A4E0S2K2_FASHE|nr:hypothetical protein D915_003236 [Fasciola hepatica]
MRRQLLCPMLLFQFLVVCLYLDSFVLTNPISRDEKPHSIFRNGSASIDHGKPPDFRGIRIRRDTEEVDFTPDNSEEQRSATGKNNSPLASTEEDSDIPSEQQEVPLVVRNNEPPDNSDASDEHTVDDDENQSVPGKVDTVITASNEESTASPSYSGEMVDEGNQLSEKSNEQDSTNFQDDQDAAHSTNTVSASQNDLSSDYVNAGDFPANQAGNLLLKQSEISLDLTESPVDDFQSTSEGDSSAPSLDEFEINELTEERSTDADESSPQLNEITDADESTVEGENQTDNDEASNENTPMNSITLTSNELEYETGDNTAGNVDSTDSEQVQSETNPDSAALDLIEKESQLGDALPNTEELVDQPVAEQQSNENEHQELDRQSDGGNERPGSSFSEPQGSLEEGENPGAVSNGHTGEQITDASEIDSSSLSEEHNEQRTDVIEEMESSDQQPLQEEPHQQKQQGTNEQHLNEAQNGDDSQEHEQLPETSSEDPNSENLEGKTKREQESDSYNHQTSSNGEYEPNHADVDAHNTPQQEHDLDSSRSELVSDTNEQPEPNHSELEVEAEPETLPESSSHENLPNIISSSSEEVPDDQQTDLTQETAETGQEESHDDSQHGQQQEEEEQQQQQQQQTAGEQDRIESQTTSTDQEQLQPGTLPEESADVDAHNTSQQEQVSDANEQPEPNHSELEVEAEPETRSNWNRLDQESTVLDTNSSFSSEETGVQDSPTFEGHTDGFQSAQKEYQQRLTEEEQQSESETKITEKEQEKPTTQEPVSSELDTEFTDLGGQPESESDFSRLNYYTENSPEQNAPEQTLHISDTDSETSSSVQGSQEMFSDKSHEASYETDPVEPLPANSNKNNIPIKKLTEKEPEAFNPYSIDSMDQSNQKVDNEEQQEHLVGEDPEQVDDSTLVTPGGSENIDESTGARDTGETHSSHDGGSQGNHIKQAEETVNLIQNPSTDQGVTPPSTYNTHESFVPQPPQWVDPSQVQSNEHGRTDVKPINPHGNESSEEPNSTQNQTIPSWSEINSRGEEQPEAEVTSQEQLQKARDTKTVHNSDQTEDPDQDESKNRAESSKFIPDIVHHMNMCIF